MVAQQEVVVQPEIAVLLEVVSAQDQVLHQLEVAHPVAVMLLEPEAAPVRKKYRLAHQPEVDMARETEPDLHHQEEDMIRDETRQNIEIVLEVVRETCHLAIEDRMSTRALRTTRDLVEVPVRAPRLERSVSVERYYL